MDPLLGKSEVSTLTFRSGEVSIGVNQDVRPSFKKSAFPVHRVARLTANQETENTFSADYFSLCSM